MGVRTVGAERGGTEVDMHQKVLQLEKNMTFLRQQHRETLQQLHREIERLKKDNRGQCEQCTSSPTVDMRNKGMGGIWKNRNTY